jgi:DNA-binding transcriptional MerR regulator
MKKKTLNIKVISNACGITPQAIRTWENRYQVFSPDRTEGGQRLYSEEDLVRAKLIVSLIDKGHTISNLASKTKEQLSALLGPEIEETKIVTTIGTKKLLTHLAQFNIDMVVSELQYLRSSVGVKEFIFQIVLPVMQEIGMLVAKGKYSITQEHIISTIIRDQLSKINLPNSDQRFGRIAIATPEGNLHELAILIADTLCRANRISTCYLGAAHPANSLAEAVSALKSDTLIMGVVSSDHWDYKKNIIPYLKELDIRLKTKIQVVLGGGYELDFPKFKNIEKVIVMKNFEEFDKMLL